jgi:hypothetical protein
MSFHETMDRVNQQMALDTANAAAQQQFNDSMAATQQFENHITTSLIKTVYTKDSFQSPVQSRRRLSLLPLGLSLGLIVGCASESQSTD